MMILSIITVGLIITTICNLDKIENFSMIDFKEFRKLSKKDKETYKKDNLPHIKNDVNKKMRDIVCDDPKLSKYCDKIVKPDRDFNFNMDDSSTINTSFQY